MTMEVALVISGISLAFGLYQGVSNIKRAEKQENKSEATQITAVIVKLETIGEGVNEIKADMRNIKNDIYEIRERLTKVEESSKSAHHRIDEMKGAKREVSE